MGLIEGRIGITSLGEDFRSLGFFPPLPQKLIDEIHADEHERKFGLPYIRLKNITSPDGVMYTETTLIFGRLNPTSAARDVAERIIKLAVGHGQMDQNNFAIEDGAINSAIYESDNYHRLFGKTALAIIESLDPGQAEIIRLRPQASAPLAA